MIDKYALNLNTETSFQEYYDIYVEDSPQLLIKFNQILDSMLLTNATSKENLMKDGKVTIKETWENASEMKNTPDPIFSKDKSKVKVITFSFTYNNSNNIERPLSITPN